MELLSVWFLLFFGLSLTIYLLLPKKIQWWALLVISLVFYVLVAKPYTIIYLILCALSVWLCTLGFKSQKHRKALLIITIIFNALMLAVLKYLGLVYSTINNVLELFNVSFRVKGISFISSLGISFYTLQMLAYLLDCYWEKIVPEKNFFKVMLFASYFPQLTSGPISRHSQIYNQLFEEHRFDAKRIANGLIRMCFGFFQIFVISNRLGVLTGTILGDPNTYSGLYMVIAILLYPLQLYTNFSGCMDLIMGVSECFGIVLPENFRAPFFSSSTQEFWQRWHITLGTWLKDYIMYPVLKSKSFSKMRDRLEKKHGKKAAKQVPTNLAMLIVWLCMGLWHGSGWHFILGEGLWFWLVLMIEKALKNPMERFYEKHNINTETKSVRIFRVIRTYLLYSVGALFFRAGSLREAFLWIKAMFGHNNIAALFNGSLFGLGLNILNIVILIVGIIGLYCVDKIRYSGKDVRDSLHKENAFGRWFCYFAMITLIILSLSLSTKEFIYAQF